MAIIRKKMALLSVFLLFAFLIVLTVTGQDDDGQQTPPSNGDGDDQQPPACPNMKPECRWEVRLRTGNGVEAATPYGVGMDILVDPDLHFPIFDLRAHGVSPRNGNYFGSGSVGTFRFNGPCLEPADFCRVSFHNLGGGAVGGAWFLVSAAVRMTGGGGPIERNQPVNRWLSRDFGQHSLSVTIDFCNQAVTQDALKN